MYQTGKGVSKDYDLALEWYSLGASQGNTTCLHNLGIIYRDGLGMDQNIKIAVMWFEKAANQNYRNPCTV